jgi:hypothetical protein
MISVDLVNAIYHHTRINERAIGVDSDSEKVTAVYDLLEELSRGDIARVQLATELKTIIGAMQNRMKQIMSMVGAVKDKRPLLDEAMQIQETVELAVSMLEQLDNG